MNVSRTIQSTIAVGLVVLLGYSLAAEGRTVNSPEWLRLSSVVAATQPYPPEHPVPSFFVYAEPGPATNETLHQFVMPSQGLPGFIYQPAIWAYIKTKPEQTVSNLDYRAMELASRTVHRKGNWLIPHVPGASWWPGISTNETAQEGAVYINMRLLANDPPPDGFNFDALLNQGADLDAIRQQAEIVMPVGNYVMLGEYGDPPSYNSFMGYLDTIYTPRPGAWADDLHGMHYLGYAIDGLDTNVTWNYNEENPDPSNTNIVPLAIRSRLGIWDALFWGGITPWLQPMPGGLPSEDLWKLMSLTKRYQVHTDLHGLMKTPETLPPNRMLQTGLAVNLFDGAADTYFSEPDSPGADKQIYVFKTGGYTVPFGDPYYYVNMPDTPNTGPTGEVFTAPYEAGYHWISAGVDSIWPTPVTLASNEWTISVRNRVAVYARYPEPGETVSIVRYRTILDVRRAAPARLEVKINKTYTEPLTVEVELRREGEAPQSWIVSRPVVEQRAAFDLKDAFGISTLRTNDVAFVRLYREHALDEWHISPLLCDEVALDTPAAWTALPQGYAAEISQPAASPLIIPPGSTWTSDVSYTHATLEFRARLPAAGTNDTWMGFMEPPPANWNYETFAKDTNDMFNLLAWHHQEQSGASRLQALFDNSSGQVEASAGVNATVNGSVQLNTLGIWGDYLWRYGNERIGSIDPTEFHTYRIEWQRFWQRWYIDHQLVYERRLVQNDPLPVLIHNAGAGDLEIEWLRVSDPLTAQSAFSPTGDVAGCAIWLKAGDLAFNQGDPVTVWPDASGNGNAVNRTGLAFGNAPAFETNGPAFLNGNPSVHFDGSALWTEAANPAIPARDIFAVVTMDSGSESIATLMSVGKEGVSPFNEVRRNGTAEVYADDAGYDFGGGIDGIIRINGAPGTGVTYNEPHLFNASENTATTYTNLYLGWNAVLGRPWKGQVAELIIYTNALTVQERNAVNLYLADKYGINGVTYQEPDNPPPVTDGLMVWLNANDLKELTNGDPVTAWPDSSGNGNEVNRLGLTWGAPPTFQTNAPDVFNGKPSLSLDSSALWTEGTSPAIPAREVFVVATMSSAITDVASVLVSLGREGVSPFNEVRRNDLTEAYGDNASYDFGGGADGVVRINGLQGNAITYDEPHIFNGTENILQTYTNLYVGWNVTVGRPWLGNVAEILIYSNALSTAERNAVGLYLSDKYGISNTAYRIPDSPPPVTNNLSAWFNANDILVADGDPVSEWEDRSGNEIVLNHSGLGGTPPILVTNVPGLFNGNAAVSFDNNSLWTETTDPAIQAQEIFAVVTLDSDSTSIATLMSLGAEGLPPFNQVRRGGTAEAYADDAAFDFGGGADGVMRINGAPGSAITYGVPHIFSSDENTATTYTNLYLGWNVVHGRPWKGYVAEILVYSSKLSTPDRNAVGLYLANKYGIDTSNYYTPDPPPPVTDGLTVWLNANDLQDPNDGDPVTEWTDSSGHGNHVNRIGLGWGLAPTFQTNAPDVFNGKPVVSFDFSTLWSEANDPVIQAQEIFAVLTMAADSESIATLMSVGREGIQPFEQVRRNGLGEGYADDAAFDFGGGAGGIIRVNGMPGTGVTLDAPHLFNATANISATYTNIYLGWNVVWGRSWKGKVAEVLIYNRALSMSERDAVELYVEEKYGITTAPPPPPAGLIISNVPGYAITWDGNDGDNFDPAAPPGGSIVPDNLALYGTAFSSGDNPPYGHITSKLNDGFYGNGNSWIGETNPAYAGILLNDLYAVTSFAIGRDNGNNAEWTQYTDRSTGTYTIEFTSDGGSNWVAIGTLEYTGLSGDNAIGNAFDAHYRHEYGVGLDGGVAIVANGIRIQVPRGGINGDGTDIDEIEVNGFSVTTTGQVTAAFSAGTEGWENAGGTNNWFFADGSMRVLFGAIGSPADENAILHGGSTASAGAFIGNYRDAGVWAIGFDFFAENINPDSLILEIVGGANAYQVELRDRLGPPGITNRLIVSLENRQAGPWSGPADDAIFDGVMTNITAVNIHVARGGILAEAYRIDNIFIDGLPIAHSLSAYPATTILSWQGIRFGWQYRMESSEDLAATNGWQPLTTVIATNSIMNIMDTNTPAPHRLYRLIIR